MPDVNQKSFHHLLFPMQTEGLVSAAPAFSVGIPAKALLNSLANSCVNIIVPCYPRKANDFVAIELDRGSSRSIMNIMISCEETRNSTI